MIWDEVNYLMLPRRCQERKCLEFRVHHSSQDVWDGQSSCDEAVVELRLEDGHDALDGWVEKGVSDVGVLELSGPRSRRGRNFEGRRRGVLAELRKTPRASLVNRVGQEEKEACSSEHGKEVI